MTKNAAVSRNGKRSIRYTKRSAINLIANIPIKTPRQTKIIFGVKATAAKTLSRENAMSINSTKQTVAQNFPRNPTENL